MNLFLQLLLLLSHSVSPDDINELNSVVSDISKNTAQYIQSSIGITLSLSVIFDLSRFGLQFTFLVIVNI